MGQEIGVDMGNNKLQIKSLCSNEIEGINNININVGSKNYCSECLGVLGDDRVKDVDNNWFCSCSCRRDYHYENRREMDSILSEFR